MTIAAEKIAEEALALPVEDRADLADRLVQSLDVEEDNVWRNQWEKEALKRLEEVRSGAVQLVPGRSAMDGLRREFGA
jgi:hypothetical protein